jgi:ribosomal protein S18 acetylase RimI-like enzyme
MMRPMIIRRAKPEDAPRLGEMGVALARRHHAWDTQRYLDLDGKAEGYGSWLAREAESKDAVVLVGEMDGELAGYVYGRLEERDWAALLDAHAALHDIWVEASARRRGLGRALAEALIAVFAELGAPRIVLHTAVQNEEAQRLFAQLGWRRTMIEMTRERFHSQVT